MKTGKILLILLFCTIFNGTAQNRNTLKELEAKRKNMLEKIEFTNQLIEQSRESEQKSQSKLNLIKEQIQNRKQLIQTLNEEIEAVEQVVSEKELLLEQLNQELKRKQDRYARSLQQMARKNRAEDKLMFILSAENLTQTYRRIRYLREYSLSQHAQGKSIVRQKESIEQEKRELLAIEQEKKELLAERSKEEAALVNEENSNQRELDEIRSQQKGLKSQLARQKKEAEAFDRQIERLIQEEIESANRRAQAEEKARHNAREEVRKAFDPPSQNNETRKADTQGGYMMTGKERVLSGNFESNKGRLPSPVSGRGVITNHFGIQKNKDYNIQTNNIGIDIDTEAGGDARAVFDGTVSRIFVLPGYHTSVMVRHGKYLTIYANLSQVYVKQGEQVKARQAIGKIFTDAESGSTQLHFQMRKETVKLNPEEWIAH